MATSTQQARGAVGQLVRDPGDVSESESESLEFFVFEDSGGGYHWAIVTGESLAQSASFGSYEEAAHAGRCIRDAAESARFERRAVEDRLADAPDCGERAANDDSDVGRWLDEGGSFRSEAELPPGRPGNAPASCIS
ncbi:MAG TPA: hypothetical protein VN672_04370 [Solirubrobacteraceae bacterium]|nr:hypothetical protein [Solirubrobacteraceae bacterium]